MSAGRPVWSIGEVLFDVIGSTRVLGGAPFNVAVHLHHLGHDTHLVSRVGDDEPGAAIRRAMRERGMDLQHLQVDADWRTGEVLVSMDSRGSPTFEILLDRAYDHLVADSLEGEPALIYFGTLVQRGPDSRKAVGALLERLPADTIVLLDVNLRAPFFDVDVVDTSLRAADLVKMTDEELEAVATLLSFGRGAEEHELARQLRDRFEIETLLVTHGERGSRAYAASGPVDQPAFEVPDYVNALGAGDAFTAIVAHGQLCGWQLEHTLETAARFSARICSVEGAVPKNADFYALFREARAGV